MLWLDLCWQFYSYFKHYPDRGRNKQTNRWNKQSNSYLTQPGLTFATIKVLSRCAASSQLQVGSSCSTPQQQERERERISIELHWKLLSVCGLEDYPCLCSVLNTFRKGHEENGGWRVVGRLNCIIGSIL